MVDVMDIDADTIQCPVCNESHHLTDMMLHMLTNHPIFLTVWSSLHVHTPPPSRSTITDIYDDVPDLVSDSDDDSDDDIDAYGTYEQMSRLCEMLGDHLFRMSEEDMNTYAPITPAAPATAPITITCPICLELRDHHATNPLRKIKLCEHVFCAICLETWLTRKRTCPLCRIHICGPD